jgi:hypothetical protein
MAWKNRRNHPYHSEEPAVPCGARSEREPFTGPASIWIVNDRHYILAKIPASGFSRAICRFD